MYKKILVFFVFIFIISSPVFAQSALSHTSSNIGMSVTDFGAFAAISGGSLTYNFRYPISGENSVGYLHPYSEIWIGDLEGNVASGYDIIQNNFAFGEFLVTQDGKLQYLSEHEGRQTITTQYATMPEAELPFELLVDQVSYSWDKNEYPDAANFIVMKLLITNSQSVDLNDIYVAISTNWNIDSGDSSLDWADWDEARNAGFVYDGDDSDDINPVHVALVLLDGRFHSYRIEPFLTESGGQNPRPFMDESRSNIMSNPGAITKAELDSPQDYMNIMVAGTYDIPRMKAIKLSFAFVAGDSLENLQENIDEAYRITYAPDHLTLKPEAGAVQLEWSKSINPSVVGYHVMRRTEQSDYERVNSSIIDGLMYDDQGLENNVKYYYKIVPVNMSGEEIVINNVTMESIEKSVMPNPIPEPPQLKVEVVNKKVELTWEEADEQNIIQYVLYRNHSGESPWATIAKFNDISKTSFVDENVYPGIDYYYSIAVVSQSEVQSDLSQSVFAKIEEEVESIAKENLDNVLVAPNPCNFASGNKEIKFMNLTGNAEITIYSAAGELIKTIYHRNNKPTEIWNCENEKGRLLTPGTYIYYITAWTSGKEGELIATGRFSVLR